MWANASDGLRWVHMDAVIRVPPEVNTYLVTTLPTPKGYPPIIVYLYINGITHLVSTKVSCNTKKLYLSQAL